MQSSDLFDVGFRVECYWWSAPDPRRRPVVRTPFDRMPTTPGPSPKDSHLLPDTYPQSNKRRSVPKITSKPHTTLCVLSPLQSASSAGIQQGWKTSCCV